jgi:hypothetical protein
MSHAPIHPEQSAKSETGESDKFANFMRRLVAVPHSEIKARIEAKKRTPKLSASHASGASPKRED